MRTCALLLVFAASCSRCAGPKSAASAEELLPRGTSGAVVSAPLATAAQHASELVKRVAQLPGGEQLATMQQQLAAQLGFDPFSREGLLAAGLDPDRGAAAALLIPAQGRGGWLAALPLTKPDLFLQTFDRLARERAGYATRTDEAREGARIAVYEGRGRIAVSVVRGYGLVARADDPAGEIARAAALQPENALVSDPRFDAQRKKLGAQDFVVFAPQGSPIPQRWLSQALPADAAAGVVGSPQGLALRFSSTLKTTTLPGGGAQLVEYLPAGAPLKLRLGIAPRQLYDELVKLAPALGKLPPALFDALEPGAVMSVALRPQANLGAAIDYGFDWRRKSPFDTIQLVALARAKDAAAARKALGELADALPQLGAKAARSGDDWTVTYPGGEGARFGVRELDGKPTVYVLGGGLAPGQFAKTAKPASPDSAALYVDQGAAAFADFGRLADAVHALPESAYGNGPQAYVARSLVSQVIEPLKSVRIEAGAVATPDGLGADLTVGLKP